MDNNILVYLFMARPNSSDADAAIAPGYLRDNSLGTNARTGIFT